jgi:hypothetical protein
MDIPKEMLTKAQNAFELSELIGRVKFKNYKRTVLLLNMYINDISTCKESKKGLIKLVELLENKYSKLNKVHLWFIRFYEWF